MTTTTHRRHRTPAVAILALAVLAVACTPPSPLRHATARPPHTCTAAAVGDSLLVGSLRFGGLEGRLATLGCPLVRHDATTSKTTTAGASVVESWARTGALPAVLVVVLGTNDCSRRTVEAGMRRILAAAGDRPVVWVAAHRPGCSTEVNAALVATAALLSRRPGGSNLWVVDHPGWVSRHPGVLATDGVHLTGAGYHTYASRIADVVATGTTAP